MYCLVPKTILFFLLITCAPCYFAGISPLNSASSPALDAPNSGAEVRVVVSPPDGKDACNSGRQGNSKVLLVSTMDGWLTALDASSDGHILWSLDAGPKLLSSSLSNLEVIYGGVPTLLVPSLDGGLYRLVHDSLARDAIVEPLPFSAETLLSSSFRLTADATIVGSRETTTYGVDLDTGQVKYVCHKDGCAPASGSHCEGASKDETKSGCLLVVKHSMQTVRAAAMRTGVEKWNFSVGQHEVKLVCELGGATCGHNSEHEEGCSMHAERSPPPLVKVDVSKGLVAAFPSPLEVDSGHALWTQQLSAAVSKAWLLVDSVAGELDLIKDGALLDTTSGNVRSGNEGSGSPMMYLGSFQKQLYVQPSPQLQARVATLARQFAFGGMSVPTPKVAWKPYAATAPSRTPWLNSLTPREGLPLALRDGVRARDEYLTVDSEQSLLVYEENEYPFDNGYYLYADPSDTASSWQQSHVQRIDKSSPSAGVTSEADGHEVGGDSDLDSDTLTDYFDHVIHVSLWYYWQEVLGISIIFAAAVNFIIYKVRKYQKLIRDQIRTLSGGEPDLASAPLSGIMSSAREALTSPLSDSRLVEYTSRYLSDFEHVQCLGRGGFGVVFEAKNKIDDCSYAIKRISLPDSLDAKERVMREVKALAKLDHPGIVRYFQAWFETPPLDWRDEPGVDGSLSHAWAGASGETVYRETIATENVSVKPNWHGTSLTSSTGSFVPNLRLDLEEVGDVSSLGMCPRVLRRTSAEDSFDVVFEAGDSSLNGALTPSPFKCYAEPGAAHVDQSSDDSFADPKLSGSSDGRPQHDDSGCHNGDDGDDCSTSGSNDKATEASAHPATILRPPRRRLLLFIQMQLCKRETLKDFLTAHTLNRNRSEMLDIFFQIANAVEYIHEQGLIHRDLKPSNIFFAAADVVKVGDFGLVTPSASYGSSLDSNSQQNTARQPEPLLPSASVGSELRKHTDNVGTQLYMSPEQVCGRSYNSKVDIYAMGLVFFELMFPFSTQMERFKIIQDAKKLVLPERFHRELPMEGNFVKWLLQPEPDRRPSILEVLQSNILKSNDAASLAEARKARQRTLSRPSD